MFDKKYKIVPNMLPKYEVGETLIMIGRTPLAGESGVVISIWPNQKTVIYKLLRKNGKKLNMNEHMLERKEN